MKNKTCCFIGQEEIENLALCLSMRNALNKLVTEYGVKRFLFDITKVFDYWSRWEVKASKNTYCGISVCKVADIDDKADDRVDTLFFDEIIQLEPPDNEDVFKWIINNSAYAVCYVTDKTNEAYKRRQYAKKCGLKIIDIK